MATLQKLEHEHRVRLEQQQQHYEDCMHDLEERMKRRFDDYIALTNGFVSVVSRRMHSILAFV